MSNQYLKLRRSGVPGKIPSTSSIDYGEIALNTYDGLAFMKKSGSNGEEVVPIGSNSGSFSGSFQGTFTGDGSGLTNLPTQSFNTGSLLTTASFNAFTASYNTGSFTGSFSGSLYGTASWAQNAVTASYYDETDPVFTAVSGTFTTTASFNAFTSSYYNDSASFDTRILDNSSSIAQLSSSFESFSSSYNNDSSSFDNRILNNSSSIALLSSSFTSFSSSYNTGSFTGQFSGSFSGSGANLFGIPASGIVGLNLSQISSGSFSASISEAGLLVNNRVVADSFTGSLFGTASWAENAISSSYSLNATSASYSLNATSASHAETASYINTLNQNVTVVGNQTISGSLTVTNNLTVLGSASVTYISESTLNIGTNLITVNTINPGARFGGLAVIDSGSSPLVSASFLYDSIQDEFLFVHKGTAGGALTSSVFLLGPETFNDVGNEIYLTQNRLPKGSGIEHLYDSNISDDGSVVSINSNTQVTGSLTVSAGISGSFSGSGANLFGIPASGIVGLNLSQITSGSYSASISEAGLLVNNRVVADSFSGSFTGSLYGTASWAESASIATNIQGGTQYYVPVWTGATTLGTSSIYDDGNVVKTVSGGIDVGLKLDFTNDSYQFGKPSVSYVLSDAANGDLFLLTQNNVEIGVLSGNASILVSDNTQTIKTTSGSNDIGLKLDFANNQYTLGTDFSGYGMAGFFVDTNLCNSIVGDGSNNYQGVHLIVNNTPEIIYTKYANNDIGLKLDFANNSFSFGDFTNFNNSYIDLTSSVLKLNNGSANFGYWQDGSTIKIGDYDYNFWNGASFFVDANNDLIYTKHLNNDIGLKLDFANTTYELGQLTGGNLTQLTIDDPTNTVSISGSTTITGSLAVTNITDGSGIDNVILYNTASGQFYYTSSAAIGGGGAFPYVGTAEITGSLLINTGSLNINVVQKLLDLEADIIAFAVAL